MKHEERMQLARELCDRFVGRYSHDVIFSGVYGSTARGLDTEWSDLEMLFVVQDSCKAHGRQLVIQGRAVSYAVMAYHTLEHVLGNPVLHRDCGWPFWMGVLSALKVLYGSQSNVDALLQVGIDVPDARFKVALEKELPGLVFESYGRILSCKERNNQDDIYCAVLEVLFEMRDALCLLNKSWVTHDYLQGLVDSFCFPRLPRRYRELVPQLWRACNIDDVIPLADELVRNFRRLLAEEGIVIHDYNTVSDITV
jgi:hypothetical protein